jgi:hypothetical protein
MIKHIVLAVFAFCMSEALFAGTCTTLSRTNYSSFQVLTASQLNTDFNTIYAPFNSASGALDGGCISDGTLEDGALNTTDFEILLNTPKEGCKVIQNDSDTLSVGRCRIAVGSNFVKTTTSTTVTWGCSGCTAEASSTKYYLYARATSTGSTLNLLISTTAPNGDGFDASNNRVLAKFYNNTLSQIDYLSVANWDGQDWDTERRSFYDCTAPTGSWVSNTNYTCKEGRSGNNWEAEIKIATTGAPTSATLTITIPESRVIDTSYTNATTSDYLLGQCSINDEGTADFHGVIRYASTTTVSPSVFGASGSYQTYTLINATTPMTWANGDFVICRLSVPIVGWD